MGIHKWPACNTVSMEKETEQFRTLENTLRKKNMIKIELYTD